MKERMQQANTSAKRQERLARNDSNAQRAISASMRAVASAGVIGRSTYRLRASDASLLARRQIDHRRHAAMRGTFVQLQLLFDDRQVVKSAERLLQDGTRIEVLDLLRPAGSVLQLLRRVALDDQEPA